jgi:protein SCO1
MFSVRNTVAAVLVAIAVAGGAWFVAAALQAPPARPEFATVLPEARPLPQFSLFDHENSPFTRENLRGRTSLLFFGFTRCPDICPATLQQLASARRRIAAAAQETDASLPQIVLISVDPERDTPEKLRSYVTHFGSGVTGVTGELEELRKLTTALGIHFERSGGGADYTVAHSSAVLVVDRNGRLQALFSAPHRVESFVHDIPLLMTMR